MSRHCKEVHIIVCQRLEMCVHQGMCVGVGGRVGMWKTLRKGHTVLMVYLVHYLYVFYGVSCIPYKM